MLPAGPPPFLREQTRLLALRGYGILDTPREADFDDLVALASRICNAPISVVNLIEEHRQWFKAEVGLGIRETPLDVSICRHVLLQPGLTVIHDLRDDPRMCDNPLVTGEDGLRFYAGCLLQTPEGHGLGTLCVLDTVPRDLNEDQRLALKTLANQVMTQLELRRTLRLRSELLKRNETLLAEVNHRTKNNLQLISSLIQLQQRRATHAETRVALLDISGRISSIANVHDKLYRADEAEAVDAAAYIQGVIEGAQATAPQVAFSLQAQAVALSLDHATPLALIANEMITNAVKYACPPGAPGAVDVFLTVADGRLRLQVRDYGPGLPVGFDHRKGRSLGMTIMRSLARQLGGTLRFEAAHPGVVGCLDFANPENRGSE
ncbi:histidine kinase dimerization/phosphoacceptor domain -containing protein [Pseudomonas sp. RIT-PI-S]|uniref:sensor histidine kinase n=1 Tax=Pseudomonas sp. RIT-PI-S TaxID=3035295 RepID=UPI0021D8E6D6|nr:histidine kinase dimerization/phosphoacceptor domain -containing protein [Pseudomonas sp. RIT-PI-S]